MTENKYAPEEIAHRLDTTVPTGPDLVTAAECIRGLDELVNMQQTRIEELERALSEIASVVQDNHEADVQELADMILRQQRALAATTPEGEK